MLSQKTRYALKALILLAKSQEQKKNAVLISELAEQGRMPQKFLEAILLELKNRGFLQSKKGKGGGYALARDAKEIRLGQVVRAFEGPLALIPCVSLTANHHCPDCDDEETLGLRVLFKEVRDATAEILDNTSLAKVRSVGAKVNENRKQMYFI
jgi:Rrf2 family protein